MDMANHLELDQPLVGELATNRVIPNIIVWPVKSNGMNVFESFEQRQFPILEENKKRKRKEKRELMWLIESGKGHKTESIGRGCPVASSLKIVVQKSTMLD